MSKYDDIINLPHHRSKTHAHMPVADRAAQFAPFAALTGYGDAVKETARLTDEKIILNSDALAELDVTLQEIVQRLPDCPRVRICYFEKDKLKEGGKYITEEFCIKKIDTYSRKLVAGSGKDIPIKEIIELMIIN